MPRQYQGEEGGHQSDGYAGEARTSWTGGRGGEVERSVGRCAFLILSFYSSTSLHFSPRVQRTRNA